MTWPRFLPDAPPGPPAGDCLRLAPRAGMAIHHLQLGGRPALVVDGVYADPSALRQFALGQQFSRTAGFYPGRFARVSEIPVALLALLNALLADRIGAGLAYAPAYHHLTLAVTLTAPDALVPVQRQPHFDSFCDYAGLVHLSPAMAGTDDAPPLVAGGELAGSTATGTGFWRHRRTGWDRAPHARGQVDAATAQQIANVMLEGLAEPAPGYPVHSNDLWELVALVPRRFNRLLAYDARVFHTPHLPGFMAPATLAEARLTQNLFLNRTTPAKPAASPSN